MSTVVLGVGMFTFTIVTLVGLLMLARHQLVATGEVAMHGPVEPQRRDLYQGAGAGAARG